MIGYGIGTIILKMPPLEFTNKKLQDREIPIIKNTSFPFAWKCIGYFEFSFVESAKWQEFQNIFACSVPFHIQSWLYTRYLPPLLLRLEAFH